MYQEHFGLERPLFGEGIVRDADVFLGPSQQRVQANLRIALSTRDSVTLLCGPAGVGKTTLAAHALRSFTARLALGWLGTPALTPHELLEQLLTAFEFEPYKSSRMERLQTWRQFLSEMSITDTRVCVLVENADQIAPEVLQALASLTASDPNGCPGANLLLTSDTPMTDRLNTPGLELLKQRLRLTSTVRPLGTEEVRHYLQHSVALAGGEYDQIFAPDCAEMLQHYSKGAIRVLNNLCETALTVAATRKERPLSAQLIMRVAVGLLGMLPRQSAEPDTSTRPSDATADASADLAPADVAAELGAPRPSAEPADHEPHTPPDTRPEVVGGLAAEAEAEPVLEAKSQSAAAGDLDTDDPDATETGLEPLQAQAAQPRDAVDQVLDSQALSARDVASTASRALSLDPSPAAEPGSGSMHAESSDASRSEERRPPAHEAPYSATPLGTDVFADLEAAPLLDEYIVEPPAAALSLEPEYATAEVEIPELTAADIVMDSDQAAEDLGSQTAHVPVLTDSVDLVAESAPNLFAGLDSEPLGAAGALPDIAAAASVPDELSADVELQQELETDAARKQRETLEALAHASALEDISNSMAETLFGDSELEALSATLAVSNGGAQDESERTGDEQDDSTADDEPAFGQSRAF